MQVKNIGLHFSFSSILLFIAALVLGLLIAVSFKTQALTTVIRPRQSELVEVVERLERERASLQAVLKGMREEITQHEEQAASKQGLFSLYSGQEKKMRKAAGLIPVNGKGMEVVLSDAKNIPPDANPNDYIIHNLDIQAIVNALWAGGAKAVSVNGQRLVNKSAIACAGTTILINSKPLVPPYIIKAVGDQDQMSRSLRKVRSSATFIKQADKIGLGINITEKEVHIPAFKGSLVGAREVEA